MKRILTLLLALALLAGCSSSPAGGETGDAAPAPTLAPAPTPVPQTLSVLGQTAAEPALEAYAAENGVTLADGTDAAAADLQGMNEYPEGGVSSAYGFTFRDLGTDPLLAAAAARAGLDTTQPIYAFPLGRSLYGYWADSAVLEALLGEGCLNDLRAATWAEWSAFAQAMTLWIADPAQVTDPVTLNGNNYTLPAEKPDAAADLAGVFARDAGDPNTYGSMFAPVLLAAGETRSAETLAGALNGLCSALALECRNSDAAVGDVRDGCETLAAGQVLFLRRPLAELAGAFEDEQLQRLVVLPIKTDLVDSDIFTEEYNLTGLMNYPILADAGWLAVPDTVTEDRLQAAAGALLWLYGSPRGEEVLTEDLLLITPWGTASDTTPVGAAQVKQVESGILPAPALPESTLNDLDSAVVTLWRSLSTADEKKEGEVREAFVQACIAALADPAAAAADE